MQVATGAAPHRGMVGGGLNVGIGVGGTNAGVLTKKTEAQQETDLDQRSGGRTRLDKCHTFKWSRQLWAGAAKSIKRTTFVCVVIYCGLITWGMLYEGYSGVDIPYFIATTVTTIGLGDISPGMQITRLGAVFVLPFGLFVLVFLLAAIDAEERATAKVIASTMDHLENAVERSLLQNFGVGLEREFTRALDFAMSPFSRTWDQVKDSMAVKCIVLMRDYVFILFVGTLTLACLPPVHLPRSRLRAPFSLVCAQYDCTPAVCDQHVMSMPNIRPTFQAFVVVVCARCRFHAVL